jgi:hypothetical protein
MTMIVFSILLCATDGKAQKTNWFIESRNLIGDSSGVAIVPTLHGLVSHDFSKKWSLWGYFQVKPKWAEVFVGGNYNLTKYLQVGLGLGFEQTPPYWRTAGSVFFSKNKNTIFYFGEYGASGYWYQTYISHKFTKKFAFGLFGQQYIGYGTRVEFESLPFVFWVAYCYDPTPEFKKTKGLAAIRLKF